MDRSTNTIDIVITEPTLETDENVRPLVYERPRNPGQYLLISLDDPTHTSRYIVIREDGETGQVITRKFSGTDWDTGTSLISTVEETGGDRVIRLITDEGIISMSMSLLLVNE
jgi:hypothetical protein